MMVLTAGAAPIDPVDVSPLSEPEVESEPEAASEPEVECEPAEAGWDVLLKAGLDGCLFWGAVNAGNAGMAGVFEVGATGTVPGAGLVWSAVFGCCSFARTECFS